MSLSYSTLWVGLGGDAGGPKATIEQTGTEASCFHGNPFYFAWYQLFPRQEIEVRYSLNVLPGDKISASVTADGQGHFRLILADRTEGWTQRTPVTYKKAKLGSAEVIAEAPANRAGNPRKLADFGTVRFHRATANGKSFNYYGWKELQRVGMTPLPVKAATSPLKNGAFTVTWKHS